LRVGSLSDEGAASRASDAVKDQAVIALRKYAGQVGGERVDDHHPARPRRIPDQENGQAAEHDPVRDFGSASLDEKLCNASWIAAEEIFLSCSSKPGRAIGEQGLPFSNGEPTPVRMPILFPGSRGGKPRVGCESLRREAEHDEADNDLKDGPAEDVRCPHQRDHTSRPRQTVLR